ncbi:MAG: ABC transporter [Chloroflexi bacterium]|nr:MAG: ABC transporter [Chloroflexota bacterium]
MSSTNSTKPHNWQTRLFELSDYRYLLRNLVVRNVKVRYKNSLFGVLWSLLNPMLMMIVYTILFTKLIPNSDVRVFPIFILVGLIPWNFFAGSLMSGTVSITDNAALVKKVYFPRLLLPTSALLSELINLGLAFIVLIIFLYVFGIGLTIYALWVPVILLIQVIFIQGVIMILSAINVFYRDVVMVMNVVLTAWFFLTPVFYPFEKLGDSATIMGATFSPAVIMRWFNPMASIIDGYRTVLWGTMESNEPVSMDPAYLLRTLVTAVVIFIIGFIFFHQYDHLFAERL